MLLVVWRGLIVVWRGLNSMILVSMALCFELTLHNRVFGYIFDVEMKNILDEV